VEIKHIKELMRDMRRSGTKKLLIKKEGFELQLEQLGDEIHERMIVDQDDDFVQRERTLQRAMTLVPHRGEPLGGGTGTTHPSSEKKEEVAGAYVTSPMVGTFYSCPSPDDPNFVKVGDRIEKHTVVCIIEAMKVMNEIKAGVSGVVEEILVENAQPVEFGTKLFRIS